MGSALSVKNYESPADRRLAGGFLADTNSVEKSRCLQSEPTMNAVRYTYVPKIFVLAADAQHTLCHRCVYEVRHQNHSLLSPPRTLIDSDTCSFSTSTSKTTA